MPRFYPQPLKIVHNLTLVFESFKYKIHLKEKRIADEIRMHENKTHNRIPNIKKDNLTAMKSLPVVSGEVIYKKALVGC